jgi:hypothetical protein
MRAEAGRPLPDYVEAEFDAYLKCGRLEEGFMRLRGAGHTASAVKIVCPSSSGISRSP